MCCEFFDDQMIIWWVSNREANNHLMEIVTMKFVVYSFDTFPSSSICYSITIWEYCSRRLSIFCSLNSSTKSNFFGIQQGIWMKVYQEISSQGQLVLFKKCCKPGKKRRKSLRLPIILQRMNRSYSLFTSFVWIISYFEQ